MTRRRLALLAAIAVVLPVAAQDADEAAEKAVRAAADRVAPSVVMIHTAGGLDVVVDEPTFVVPRYTSYDATRVSSVEAVQEMVASLCVTRPAWRPVGTDGGVVSGSDVPSSNRRE